MRGWTVSDVGTSSRPMPVPGGRKLKKRTLVSASAGGGGGGGENWSTMSTGHHQIFHILY